MTAHNENGPAVVTHDEAKNTKSTTNYYESDDPVTDVDLTNPAHIRAFAVELIERAEALENPWAAQLLRRAHRQDVTVPLRQDQIGAVRVDVRGLARILDRKWLSDHPVADDDVFHAVQGIMAALLSERVDGGVRRNYPIELEGYIERMGWDHAAPEAGSPTRQQVQDLQAVVAAWLADVHADDDQRAVRRPTDYCSEPDLQGRGGGL